MATETPLFRDGANVVTDVDYSGGGTQFSGPGGSGQFLAFKLTAAGRTVTLANAGGEDVYGILQNAPTAGGIAEIGLIGVSKAVAGAVIAAGAQLMTDTSGRVITATGTNHRIGNAIEAATAAGAIITMNIRPIGTVT